MRKPNRPLAAALVLLSGLALAASASAQSSPSAYTFGIRYDALGRVTGTIAPDPDGGGPLTFMAVRTTYDGAGRPIEVENGYLDAWQSESTAPASWSGFHLLTRIETTYDSQGRKLTETHEGSDLAPVSVTQYSYDAVGRLQCTAVRMNIEIYNSLPSSACTLGTQGSEGPDRITKNVYDSAGQLLQVREAVGTADEGSEATYSYTSTGLKQDVIDANGNKAELRYDGFDRQARWVFPSTTRPGAFSDSTPANALATSGALNEADYEAYTYDANGNRLTLRKRDGSTLSYTYDFLDRMTKKTVPERAGLDPTHTRDVYYDYDLHGRETKARFDSLSGEGDTTTYDELGRVTSATEAMDGDTKTLSYLYDKDGDRTRTTYPDASYFNSTFDGLDRLNEIQTSGGAVLVDYGFNNRGSLASDARYSTMPDRSFGYDNAGRLSALAIVGGPSVSWTFSRNPANGMRSEVRDNDAYAWNGQTQLNRTYTTNGLNQYTADSNVSYTFDANGNLKTATHVPDGSGYYDDFAYTYDIENRLVTAVWTNRSVSGTSTVTTTLRYDPLGRLHEVNDSLSGTTRFLYDGDALVSEYDGSTSLLRRFIHGTDAGDDPLVWWEGSALRELYADAHGSIVLVRDSSGATVATNTYDEYGIPGSANQGRFQYTGQEWLPEIGMYYYKARIYSPTLGRFLQTDPIGYEDQVNLYAYVANDPVNKTDPTGNSITEIGFLIYDVGQGISDVAHGASAGELINDAVNIGLDVEPVPGLREVKGAVEVGRAVEKGVEAARAERTAAREVGSYRHTFESGRTYDGKGTRSRAEQSAREVSTRNNDPHVSTKFTPASNSREAFKQESKGIQERGGPKSDQNYNRIDSLGTKMRKQDGEP